MQKISKSLMPQKRVFFFFNIQNNVVLLKKTAFIVHKVSSILFSNPHQIVPVDKNHK